MSQGLYSLDGAFRSDTEIKESLLQQELNQEPQDPQYCTPLPANRDFTYWNNRFARRTQEHQEIDEAVKYALIALPNHPCLINFGGDNHVGNYSVQHERIRKECELIKATPFSYFANMGDIVDHFSFTPAQTYDEIEQIPEQVEWARSLFRFFNDGVNPNKMLFSVVGNHDDKWAKKTGLSLYHNFSREYHAYLFRGPSRVDLKVGEITYHGAISHQYQGFSGYNPNHPQTRLLRDNAMGLTTDFVVSGHTHRKAVQQQSYGDGINGNRVVVMNIGCYKRTDSYGEDKGFTPATNEQMGGGALILLPEHKYIIPFDDILEAHEIFRKHFLGLNS